MRKHARTTLIALAAGAALALVGCGGGDDEGSSATSTGAEQRPGSTQAGAGGGGPGAGGGGQAQEESRPAESDARGRRIADVNPEGEDPPTAKQLGIVRGGDNSLQTFGSDAEGDEREGVVTAMSAYFTMQDEDGEWRATVPTVTVLP